MKKIEASFSALAPLKAEQEPISFLITATPVETADIAERLGVEAAADLYGDGVLTVKGGKNTVREAVIEGTARAKLTRICVASLAPLEERIDAPFRLRLARALTEDDAASDEDIDLLEGEDVDLGDLIVQQIALAMDPYPRAESAPSFPQDDAPPDDSSSAGPEAKASGAFAGLKNLLKNNENP